MEGGAREGVSKGGGLARRLPLPLLRGAGGGKIMPQGLRGDPSRKPGGLRYSLSFSLGWHLLCTSFKSVMVTDV